MYLNQFPKTETVEEFQVYLWRYLQ